MTGATLTPAPPTSDRKPPPSPYKGLTPYTEEDVDFFFGREQETEIIRANLLASRLTLLYGESGVGKSSVLHAGAAHRLRQEARQNLESYGRPELAVVVFRTWRDDPVSGLLGEVERVVTDLVGKDGVEIPEGAGLAESLHAWAEHLEGDLLVILDQFEEYFLYHGRKDGPGAFAYEFPRAVNRLDLRVSFLVSIREDGLAKLDVFKGRIPGLFDNRLRIDHLSRANARAAIEGPVRAYNERAGEDDRCGVEPELVEKVLDQIGGTHVNLGQVGAGDADGAAGAPPEGRIQAPYLQLVLTRIWNEEQAEGSRVLRAETLDRCGGAETIVRTRLDEAMDSLSPEEQDIAASVFHFLVTRSGAKVAHAAADLASFADLPEQPVTDVVEHMAGGDVRILRPVPPPPGTNGATRYEIFHDVIGPAILDWRARHVEATSRRQAEKRARRERVKTRIWAVVALLSLAACAAVAILALWAVDQKRSAQTERRTARAQALAAQASLELENDPARSAAIALDALDLRETPAARRVLLESLADLHVTHVIPGVEDPQVAVASLDSQRPYLLLPAENEEIRVVNARSGDEISTLSGHTARVVTMAFSPDARQVVTGGWDEEARIWDTATGEELHLIEASNEIQAVAFGPAGRVAVGDFGGRLSLWDAESGDRLAQARLAGGRFVDRASFSTDGTRLLTLQRSGGPAGSVHLWDVSGDRLGRIGALPELGEDEAASGAKPGVPAGGDFLVAKLSQDGTRIVTVGQDGRVRLWDAATLSLARTLPGPVGQAYDADFSPDGRLVAAAQEKTVRIWRTDSGRFVSEMRGHPDWINAIAFRGDGRTLVSAGADGTARVWEVPTGLEIFELRGHTGAIFVAEFVGDRRSLLATVSEDKTARTWSADAGTELRGHRGWVLDLAMSPGGEMVATVGADGQLITWDPRTGRRLNQIQADTVGAATSVAFSSNGNDILTAGHDTLPAIWSTDTLEFEALFNHDAIVNDAAFNPDGTRVLTGSDDWTARVWDREKEEELFRLKYEGADDRLAHQGSVRDVAYSPDGERMVTVGDDGVVRVWDATNGDQLREVDVHRGAIYGIAFHPEDPNLVVTSSRDRTAIVWSVENGRPLVTLPHSEAVTTASFSPDGTRVVTGSPTGSVRIWEWRSEQLLGAMRMHADYVNAAEFSPDGRTVATAADDRLAKVYTCPMCVPLDEVREDVEARLRELGQARRD